MNRVTLRAFSDELVKISASRNGRDDAEGPGESYYQSNSSAGPSQEGNPGWGLKPDPATPGGRANILVGLPLNSNKRGLKRYDDTSEAKSDDRNQSPITGDGSVSAVSTSNALSPQTGPGGV